MRESLGMIGGKIGAALHWLADHRLFVLGFGVATATWPTLMSPTYTPRWAVMAVLLPLCSKLDPRDLPVSIRWVLLWILGLGLVATTWASPDPMGGYLEMMFVAMLCLAFIAGSNMDSIDEVMTGLGWGLGVSVFCSFYQLSGASDQGRDGLIGQAPTGLFGNSEVFAEFAALVFVWAIARGRIVLTAIAMLPLVMCNERLSLFVALAGALYAYGPRSKLKMAACVLGLIGAGCALLVIFGFSRLGSVDHRVVIWLATLSAWTQFGHGFGWFQASHPQEEFAHSDALQAIAELGIGGFALLAIPVMGFLSKRGNNAERALLVAVCIEVAFSFPLHMPAQGFVAAIVAGMLVSRRPVVFLGSDLVGHEDGFRLRRGEASGSAVVGGSEGIGGAVSVRSVQSASAQVCRALDRVDTAAAVRGF